jgi:transposase
MLALAMVLDGADRKSAAACGMDRQTLRDWVHRYNVESLRGLHDLKTPGPKPNLTAEQQAELAKLVEAGPDPACHGVVRWRRVDLRDELERRFGVVLHERSVGKVLVKFGYRRLSVRPRHPQADEEVQEAFKKTSPRRSWHSFPNSPKTRRQGTLTRVWARRGTRPRAPRVQRYSGLTFLAPSVRNAALRQRSCPTRPDTDAMSIHLAEIGRRVAPGAHAALVIDGAGYHVAARLAVPPNITLVRLPPYAPELNPIENVWEYLRGNKLVIPCSKDTTTSSTNPAPCPAEPFPFSAGRVRCLLQHADISDRSRSLAFSAPQW